MASTYSPLLRFELPASGEQAGLWGNTENVQIGTLLEQALAGTTTVTLTSTANYTLSTLNGTPDEARAMTLVFTGTPGGNTTVILPSLQKTYHIRNTTPNTLTFKTNAQVGGVALGPGGATVVNSDGVNIYSSINGLYYTQMNFLTKNGGANAVPQFDGNGNLAYNTTISGTWDSGGGSYSVPTNVTGFASVKPIFGLEGSAGARFQSNGVTGAHLGDVVNAVWTGGTGGSFKFTRTGPSTLYIQGDELWWWGWASGNAGATANYALSMYIDGSTGNLLTKFNLSVSDRRIKTELLPIGNALSKVKQLVGYTFLMADDPERKTGVIAQDVQKVLPEAVLQGVDGYLAVAYGHLAGLFVEAIKELEMRVAALEERCG